MLFLTVFGNDLKEKKNIVLTVAMVSLLVLSGLLSLFMYSPVMVQANPAAYVYTEGFDDDVNGTYFINESWYNATDYHYVAGNTTFNSGDNVTEDVYYVGNRSFQIVDDDTTANRDGFAMNLTNCSSNYYDIEYVSWYWNFTSLDNGKTWRCIGLNQSSEYNYIFLVGLKNNSGTYELSCINGSNTGHLVNNTLSPLNTWYYVNITNINYTAETYDIYLDGDLQETGVVFYDSHTNNSGMTSIYFTGSSVTTSGVTVYIDNITVGSNDELNYGGGQGYPTINSTAFNSSLTDVDGNYSITFNSTVNNTILWSNSSGTANETMNITIVDGNESVAYINITLNNLTDGGSNYINADDFYLYVYNDSSTNWINKSSFPTDGGNITLDASDTDINVTWPITGAETILCRFKLVVSDSQAMVDYTATDFGVYIGG